MSAFVDTHRGINEGICFNYNVGMWVLPRKKNRTKNGSKIIKITTNFIIFYHTIYERDLIKKYCRAESRDSLACNSYVYSIKSRLSCRFKSGSCIIHSRSCEPLLHSPFLHHLCFAFDYAIPKKQNGIIILMAIFCALLYYRVERHSAV